MARKKRNLKGDSLKLLAERGWLAGDVEMHVPGTHNRRDLFGLFDIVAVHPSRGILGLQVTNSANLGNHVTAALSVERARRVACCLRAGLRVEYWGWRPKGNGTILSRTFKLSNTGDMVIAWDGSDVLEEGERDGDDD